MRRIVTQGFIAVTLLFGVRCEEGSPTGESSGTMTVKMLVGTYTQEHFIAYFGNGTVLSDTTAGVSVTGAMKIYSDGRMEQTIQYAGRASILYNYQILSFRGDSVMTVSYQGQPEEWGIQFERSILTTTERWEDEYGLNTQIETWRRTSRSAKEAGPPPAAGASLSAIRKGDG